MKSFLMGVFLLSIIVGYAQNKQREMKQITNLEKEVIAVTDKLTDLMIARDLKGMDNILDTHFTLTHITGYVQPKAEWFREVKTESMKYYSYEPVSREVNVNGDKAQVVQRNKLDARIWGSRNVWRLQQIFSLEKRSGKWIIIRSIATTF